MRILHRPLWEGVVASLKSIFIEGRVADKVIQYQLKNQKKWGSQDRRLVAESVYDIVRWWRRLLYCVGLEWHDHLRDFDDRIFNDVVVAWCLLNEVELGRGISKSNIAIEEVRGLWRKANDVRSIRESIPDWLDSWGEQQLTDRWDQMLPILNSPAPVYLRANRLKTDACNLVQKLRSENIECQIVEQDALVLKKRMNIFTSKNFHDGLFEVQDLNSQRIASEVGARPGERIIDACAGAGGKTLALASYMGNKGKVIALDVGERKLEQLRIRARRAGASIIETRLIESSKVWKRLESNADRLLLDVPCSGVGVLRRNPDAKWRLSLAEVHRLENLQAQILADYSSLCKPGGTLVYATCSIMPAENEKQIEKFLSQSETRFSLAARQTLWPQRDGPDGFFYARLLKS